MKHAKFVMLFIALEVHLLCGCADHRASDSSVSLAGNSEQYNWDLDSPHWQDYWLAFLDEKFQIGETRDSVEKKLENMYLHKIELLFNSGLIYAVIYRVDDVSELYFEFGTEDDALRRKPISIPPTAWIRNPWNGKALHVIDRKTGGVY